MQNDINYQKAPVNKIPIALDMQFIGLFSNLNESDLQKSTEILRILLMPWLYYYIS